MFANLALFLIPGMIFVTQFFTFEAQAADFETLLDCDDGALLLQVNRNERRNFQVVVKDTNIIAHFLGKGAFRNYGTNFGNGREFITGGYLQNGLFSATDFSNAQGKYNYGDSFKIIRQDSGLKLELRSVSTYSYCDGTVNRDYGTCNGTMRDSTTVHEYANWYFQECR